jgi:hypothetical protein
MARDYSGIAGAMGLVMILAGLSWKAQDHGDPMRLPKDIYPASSVWTAAPCPPVAPPKVLHSLAEPLKLLPELILQEG